MSRSSSSPRRSTRHSARIIAIALTALASSAASAGAPPTNDGRYTLAPVDGGYLRLDRQTGEVAMCTKAADAWTCEATKDRTRTSADTAKLEAENKLLRDRLEALEKGTAGPASPEAPATKGTLPTEEEVDKALDYVENVFKKFKNRIEKYQSPTPAPAPAEPPANDSDKGGKQSGSEAAPSKDL